MNKKEFIIGTEFELNGSIYIVTKVNDDSKWIYFKYKDGRKISIEEQGYMQFMPMSNNWCNSNIL